MAAGEHPAATLRAEFDAPRIPADADEEKSHAETELGQVRASLAEAETALEATRTELTRATDQLASLAKVHDQTMTDHCRLASELAVAEERVADLERRLAELTESPAQVSRPVPF